jgi:hypothetical protein
MPSPSFILQSLTTDLGFIFIEHSNEHQTELIDFVKTWNRINPNASIIRITGGFMNNHPFYSLVSNCGNLSDIAKNTIWPL